jgi:hypothetical protein
MFSYLKKYYTYVKFKIWRIMKDLSVEKIILQI